MPGRKCRRQGVDGGVRTSGWLAPAGDGKLEGSEEDKDERTA